MATTVFLEVEPEDTEMVQKQYPDCLVITDNVHADGVLEQCHEAEVLSCFIYSNIGTAELDAMPNLKLILTRSVGFDHIGLGACSARDITVCNVPDYGSHVIAEHVFALLLSRMRNITEADARVEEGVFNYQGLRGMALRGKTIGIIGTGRIGRRAAQIAHGFSMRILAVDKCRTLELVDLLGVEYVLLEEALAQSDILTLHVPAIPETEHLINAERIAQMKKGMILVNTARGSLIDSAALLDALNDQTIAYALLDVLEHEENFEKNRALIEHPHVTSTPHIGFYADDSMQNMYDDCFASIEQWRAGGAPDHTVHAPKIVCDLPGISG